MVIALAYISYFKSLFLHELNRVSVFYLNVLVKYDIVNVAIDESEINLSAKEYTDIHWIFFIAALPAN